MQEDDDELNLDWLNEAENLCNSPEEYGIMPYIRVIYLYNSGDNINYSYKIKPKEPINESLFFHDEEFIIRDISLFYIDVQKHQLNCIPTSKYISFDSISDIREKLKQLRSFPCFFDIFELIIVFDKRPTSESVSILKTSTSKNKNKNTRKRVRFLTTTTRRAS